MTIFLGFGAAAFVGNEAIIKANPAGNMAAPLLAKALGGDFLFAFVSAIAFATILAVVAGLVLTAASAFAHDFYNEIIRKGKSTEKSKYPWLVMHLLSSDTIYHTCIICPNIKRSIFSIISICSCSECKSTSNFIYNILEAF